MSEPKSTAEEIREKLQSAFAPQLLEVIDESHQHAGHAGHSGQAESHFRVKIQSDRFAGHTRIKRHRMVHEALGRAVMGRIHALSLEIA